MEEWEERARGILIDTSKIRNTESEPQYVTLTELDAILAEGDDIEAALPSYHALQAAVTHARDWLAKVNITPLELFLTGYMNTPEPAADII